MISLMFSLFSSLFIGCLFAYCNKFDNEQSLFVRRLLFVTAIAFSFIIVYVALHIEVNCDLRPNATTPCEVAWIK